MGPGFGEQLEKAAMTLLAMVVIVCSGISIAIWELGKWLFRHLEIGWN